MRAASLDVPIGRGYARASVVSGCEEKSLRQEPVKKRPGEQGGPGSEEAPVRSGRCPPFQGRIFPPSSPGEKVAPLNRSVAAQMGGVAWRWWLSIGGTRHWDHSRWHQRWAPRGLVGACAISLMVPRCAQDTCCTRAPYIARRLPPLWLSGSQLHRVLHVPLDLSTPSQVQVQVQVPETDVVPRADLCTTLRATLPPDLPRLMPDANPTVLTF